MDNKFKPYHKTLNPSKDTETKKELTEEEILNSNDVELIVKYAKENRSKEAIDKVRELLELARKNGEEVVQNFLASFKECEEEKKDYSNFENTESGKLALDLLQKMPEPFRTNASKKLEDYKKELNHNTELFKKHKNNPEKIWKEVFGFDYHDIPEFKERFKTFFFQNMRAISKDYYKKYNLEVKQDPFAINFFVEDPEKFGKAYGDNVKKAYDKFGGFSSKEGKTHANVIKINKLKSNSDIKNTTIHEAEHAIHEKVSPLKATYMHYPWLLNDNFEEDKIVANNKMRLYFLNNLKNAEDEIFAYLKGGTRKEQTEKSLLWKIKDPLFKEREEDSRIFDEIRDPNHLYDYNEEMREANYKSIELSQYLSDAEKNKLKDAIDFMQSEYERVLRNMIDVIYEKEQSVEFFRNVPINELWKYSNGKYSRTDFIIKEFKF
ncbi:MAG: hypothetical protein KBD52_02975 [Candidatus Pacebacteria bacterium]|nr:hypothetical protein [Candidatus Paceibacterota bacterium]